MDHGEIVRILKRHKIPVGTEKAMQSTVGQILRDVCEISPVGREWRFSEKDRVDFFLPAQGIAIECKVEGGHTDVIEQLLRYAEYEKVQSIILVTRRHSHLFEFDTLNNKPFSVVWVSRDL